MPNLFSIDKEKCKQDGICVSACAARVIEMGPDGFPQSTEEAADFCINCGHCMSACPHGALSLKAMNLESCAAIDGALAPAFGLGTCWCGYLMASANNFQPLVDELSLPDGHKVCGAMFIGYPGLNYQRLPARNEPTIFWR